MEETIRLNLDYLDKDGNKSKKYFTIKMSKLKDVSDNYFGRSDLKWEMYFSMVIPDHYYDKLINKTVPRHKSDINYTYGKDFKKTIKSQTIKGLCDQYVDLYLDCLWLDNIDKQELSEVIFYRLESEKRLTKSKWDSTELGEMFKMDMDLISGYIDKDGFRYNKDKKQISKNNYNNEVYSMKYVTYSDERFKFFVTMMDACRNINNKIQKFKENLTEDTIDLTIKSNNGLFLNK